jgi:hypothetical protein
VLDLAGASRWAGDPADSKGIQKCLMDMDKTHICIDIPLNIPRKSKTETLFVFFDLNLFPWKSVAFGIGKGLVWAIFYSRCYDPEPARPRRK